MAVLSAVALIALTFLNHWPVVTFGFAWDDYAYLVRNYPIQEPVSLRSLWWCLTRFAQANWHPLTWLTLHLEYQVFGTEPRGYHLVNLLLHTANVVLLDAALWRLTKSRGKSFVVAALFAVHPLHVESVAWITEIKDVLSTLLLLLLIHNHTSASRNPGAPRQWLAALLLTLGLMAKGMLVTAPLLLLLLDWWPLGRFANGPPGARPDAPCPRHSPGRLVREKIPLLLLAVAAGLLTLLAQHHGGALADLTRYPPGLRLANAANAAVLYLWRLFRPWPLSFYYPFEAIALWRAMLCALLLAAITVLAVRLRHRLPALCVGWGWYVVSILPVLGLIQVGSQAMADRYAYIPSIGLLVAVVWTAAAALARAGLDTLLDKTLAAAAIIAAMVPAFAYLGHWENEETLYRHALAVNAGNAVAHNNYANILLAQKRYAKALAHYAAASRIAPSAPLFLTNAGTVYLLLGHPGAALSRFDAALEYHPGDTAALTQKAVALLLRDKSDAAADALRRALAGHPQNAKAALLLAAVLIKQGQRQTAATLLVRELAGLASHDPLRALALRLFRQTQDRVRIPAANLPAPAHRLSQRVLEGLGGGIVNRDAPLLELLRDLGYPLPPGGRAALELATFAEEKEIGGKPF